MFVKEKNYAVRYFFISIDISVGYILTQSVIIIAVARHYRFYHLAPTRNTPDFDNSARLNKQVSCGGNQGGMNPRCWSIHEQAFVKR